MEAEFVVAEPGTSTQFEPSPIAKEFVWTCKIQPAFAGQDKFKFPPAKEFVRTGLAGGAKDATAMVPLMASLLVQ